MPVDGIDPYSTTVSPEVVPPPPEQSTPPPSQETVIEEDIGENIDTTA